MLCYINKWQFAKWNITAILNGGDSVAGGLSHFGVVSS